MLIQKTRKNPHNRYSKPLVVGRNMDSRNIYIDVRVSDDIFRSNDKLQCCCHEQLLGNSCSMCTIQPPFPS